MRNSLARLGIIALSISRRGAMPSGGEVNCLPPKTLTGSRRNARRFIQCDTVRSSLFKSTIGQLFVIDEYVMISKAPLGRCMELVLGAYGGCLK